MKKTTKKLLSLALSAVMVSTSAMLPASAFASQAKGDNNN